MLTPCFFCMRVGAFFRAAKRAAGGTSGPIHCVFEALPSSTCFFLRFCCPFACACAFFPGLRAGELSIGIAIGGEEGETSIAERAPHGQRHCAHLRSAHAPRRSHDFSKTAAKRFVIDAIALYAIVAV